MIKNTRLINAISFNDIYKLIKILGLKDFEAQYKCCINQDVLNRFLKAGLPEEYCKQIEDCGRSESGKLNAEWLKRWISLKKMSQSEKKEAVLSIVENEKKLFKPALISLENEGDGKKLALINDNCEELSLSPEQLILLLESPNETVVLANYAKVDGINFFQDEPQVVATIHQKRGQLITFQGFDGEPVTDANWHIRTCYFDIDIKMLIMYYAIFKREEIERASFLQSRHKSRFQPQVDIQYTLL
jgi:hypothetical protein